MDTSSKAWKKAIYERIRLAYKADNPNHLTTILNQRKFKFSRSTVYFWSNGESKPTEKALRKISADRNLPLDYFLQRDSEMPANDLSKVEDIQSIQTETLLNYLLGQAAVLKGMIGQKAAEELLQKVLIRVGNDPEEERSEKTG